MPCLQLQVTGLRAAEQAEEARDLLALWSWLQHKQQLGTCTPKLLPMASLKKQEIVFLKIYMKALNL